MARAKEFEYLKKQHESTAWGRFTLTANGDRILEGLVKGGKTGNNLAYGDKYYKRFVFGGKPAIYVLLYGINDGNLGSEAIDPPEHSVFPTNNLDDRGVRQGIVGGPGRNRFKPKF